MDRGKHFAWTELLYIYCRSYSVILGSLLPEIYRAYR